MSAQYPEQAPLDVARIKAALKTAYIGQKLAYYAAIGSTNDVARDLAQGQITLPIIYSLSTGSAAQRAELLAALDGAPSHDIDPARVRKLIADAGGFEYAGGCVQSFADQAVRCLEPLAHSPAREALSAIARDGLAAPIVTGG